MADKPETPQPFIGMSDILRRASFVPLPYFQVSYIISIVLFLLISPLKFFFFMMCICVDSLIHFERM